MADEKKLKKAQTVFKTMCDMLDERDWHYKKEQENLRIFFGVTGDDIPMQFQVAIDADRELIRVFSPLPFEFSAQKRLEGAIVTSYANYIMVDGSFDYSYDSGDIMFRITSSYRESLISKELFVYLIQCAINTVDDFNDKFLMVSQGHMSVEDFMNNKK